MSRSYFAFRGSTIAPDQSLEFQFARNASGVYIWELEGALDPGRLDTKRYFRLLDRAARTVINSYGQLIVSESFLWQKKPWVRVILG